MERSAKQRTILVMPPGQSAAPERAATNNLPAYLTPLIGREQEVQAICALLQRPEVRLVTLTGSGGVGKTRLGVQIATEVLNDFADGVSFVSLAPISDPDLVIPTIAKTFDLTVGDAPLELLKAFLREQQLLLLLDNFEQVVAAAPLVVELLGSCPKVKALVTSRMVLRVQGEYDFSVQPLSLPDLTQLPGIEALPHYAAVALFLQRAQAIRPDFQLTSANARAVAEICTRLDGLPLAIELAAARLNLLSPQALLARLEHRLAILTSKRRDVPARQQTLRDTLEWSYSLLTPEEQRLFRRLSVFVGGCQLSAVEAVCTALGDVPADVLDGVASLLDKSLLQRAGQEGAEPRLVMLETIHEFGLECLAASGGMEATQHAHAGYYLSLLEKAWQNALGAEEWRWHARLEQEYADLRAALRWSVEQGGVTSVETVLRLSQGLFRFWEVRGGVSEGRRWLERALARGEEGVTFGRARGFFSAGALAFTQDDYDQAEALLRQSELLYRKLADPSGIGAALHKLGQVALALGNYTLARSLTEEALAHFREAGDKWSQFGTPLASDSSEPGDKWTMYFICLALDNLVRVGIVQGEYAEARSLAEESLALSRPIDDRRNMVISLFHLALLTFSEGEQTVAHSLVEESLTISREIHFKWGLALSLGLLSLMALQQGDEAAAYALLEESLTMRREVGDRLKIRWGLYCLGWVAFARWDSAVARVMYEKLLKVLRRLDDKELLATCLEGLGSVVASQGAVERPQGDPFVGKQPWEAATQWAVRLWGMAEAFREVSCMPLLPGQNPAYEHTVTAIRAQFGEEAFATLWSEGRSMTPEQAIAALQRAEMPQQGLSAKPSATYPAGLTQREVEVLRLVAKGLTIGQIAEQLMISFHTANAHVRSIYNKLEVTSRSTATRYAIEHHLF
jgi:predicted ATPase/DNA-binding CsgD family transcriptional regulator